MKNNELRDEVENKFPKQSDGVGGRWITASHDEIADFCLSKLDSLKAELVGKFEEYFKGLILIPDPQATKEYLIKLIKEL